MDKVHFVFFTTPFDFIISKIVNAISTFKNLFRKTWITALEKGPWPPLSFAY
jgi:hypothetical protein